VTLSKLELGELSSSIQTKTEPDQYFWYSKTPSINFWVRIISCGDTLGALRVGRRTKEGKPILFFLSYKKVIRKVYISLSINTDMGSLH
jgi:hypothetical protein